MLGPQDMKNIAQMMDPGMESGYIREEVIIEHLDYAYVSKCEDKHELHRLLEYLQFFCLTKEWKRRFVS
jgi:hypothetical protein